MVIELSEKARKTLSEYLDQVKRSLKGVKYIDADEIVQNVNEHIENELGETPEPVSSEKLGAVLEKLGSPLQWVPEEEISWWRKVILRIYSGPEDWRLAYLSFGLFFIAFLFHSKLSFSVFVILVIASFIVSRAALAAVNGRDELRGQKWFIYPSLIIVTLFFVGVLFSIPLFILIPIAGSMEQTTMEAHNIRIDDHYLLLASSIIGMITCLWCMLVGIICLIFPELPKKLLYPVADWFRRKHAIVLIALAFFVFTLFLILWIYSVNTYVY